MKIEENRSLKSFNTFGMDAKAKYFSEVRSVEEFRELAGDSRFPGEKKLILGGGSNVLLTGDFDGWVVKNAIPGVTVVSETENEAIVKVGAGEDWHALVLWCVQKNYGGLENLSLIPGLTGAAPIQNIGAYGAEQKDVFHELEAIGISSLAPVKFTAKDCAFGYRDSVFKNKFKGQFLITSVSFKLTKLSATKTSYRFRTEYGDLRRTLDEMKVQALSLKAVSDAICQVRRAKLPDPKELGNAGSFFKNPSISQAQFQALASEYPKMPHYPQPEGTVKVPAGWLIETCGWKGKTMGRAGSHKTQALVLVNYGGATAQEILELSGAISRSVKEKFAIELSPEVNIV
ncbi:MAG: UDP-N-acetylmuramate dehydrogenase [Candidatus Omnitrophica bacterium]|nr:UDP-N-acetylmuramate dehydrogenase [Candidatus Omnitrophota bacterium]